jgi:hypothetical protein
MKPRRYPLVLFVLSFLIAVSFNEWNLSVMRDSSVSLREHVVVRTADDTSYLGPMKRLYETGSLYTNETEKWQSIVRSPGYGLLYYGCLMALGPDLALIGLKWLKYLLFALSVPALFVVLHHVLNHPRWAFIGALIYGCAPFSYGFLAYTLTEAVTPALLIFTYYFLVKARIAPEKTFKWWVFAAVLGGWVILTRPVLGLFILPLVGFIWSSNRKQWMRLSFLAVLLILPIGTWQLRHKVVLGSFQSLHPIYQHEVPGMYRLPHESLWHLVKSWEYKSAHFHELTRLIWGGVGRNEDPLIVAEQVLKHIPEHVVETLGQTTLENYLVELQTAIRTAKTAPLYGEPLGAERAVAATAYHLARQYRLAHWFHYAVVTPFNVYREMVFHSNLPYYAIQGKYRGTIWVETLRIVSFIIHSILLTLVVLLPFYWLFRWKHVKTLLSKAPNLYLGVCLVVASAAYLWYLIFVQRGIEERYTLPVLWIALLGSFQFFRELFIHREQKPH